MAFFGDGAANQGVLHESLNLAAIWNLPVVYVCENNGFAESTPAAYATSVEDIAVRGSAYGIPGAVVDSRDVLAVYEVAQAAIDRARRGDGPTLLEAKTYRIRGHFEGDPELYRDDDERREAAERDPLPRLRERLLADGTAGEPELETMQTEILAAIEAAIEFAKASPWPDPRELTRYVYAGEAAAG